jgi:lysyl-tRNA synthetase class 2
LEEKVLTDEIENTTKEKLETLKEMGVEPYSQGFKPTHYSRDIIESFESLEDQNVAVAGRLVTKRSHGKASFAHLQDVKGRLQIYARLDSLGEENYKLFKLLDVGDIIGVKGRVFKTHTGEITIHAEEITLLAKSLLPLPEKWHGLKDTEVRYRQRYLDLIANESSFKLALLRSKTIQKAREYLNEHGFMEVETPMMHPVPGGAAAKPFITHHNALDLDLYLRIAPELYLKRLLVGGMDKIYELGRVFRNEGISTKHNPEFTMLEVYQAYADYEDMLKLSEELVFFICQEVLGKSRLVVDEIEIDLTPPWKRLTMLEAIQIYTGIDFRPLDDEEAYLKVKELGVELNTKNWGEAVNAVFEEFVEEKLIEPIFILDYPLAISPLAKKKKDDPRLVYRFEPFVLARELGNAFTELNDPLDQEERFLEQLEKRKKGDEEAHPLDEDFLTALAYGMPPAGGLGIGIDRLIMLLSGASSIRDVILFPTLKPRE